MEVEGGGRVALNPRILYYGLFEKYPFIVRTLGNSSRFELNAEREGGKERSARRRAVREK